MRKHSLAKCEDCPLQKEQIAPTTGPKDAKIALVSRSPGRYDVEHGIPFSGPSGRIVDHLLKLNGLKRDDIITTNVVLCQTDDPPKEAIAACKDRLNSEIAQVETIIAGGSEAVKLYLQTSIDNARGIVWNLYGKRIVATNNPALVLRDADSFPNLVKDFKRAINPTPTPSLPKVTIVRDVEKGKYILNDILRNPPPILAADIEARGGTTHRAELACIGLSASGEKAVVFGIEPLSDPSCFNKLKLLLEGTTRFIWHFGKYDVKALRFNGINARVDHDTLAMSIALDERPGVHSLEYLLQDEFGWPDYEPDSVKEFKKTGRTDNLNELYEYNGWDVAGTMQLYRLLEKRAKDDSVYDLYAAHLLPIYRSFVDIELRGFHYNAEEAANLREAYVIPRLWELRDELRILCDHSQYNPRSPQQTQAILYNDFGLRHNLKEMQRKSKEDSTDHWVRVEIMAGRFKCKPGKSKPLVEFATKLEEYSKLTRSNSNYIEALIKKVQHDGKLYTSFKFGAVTGRSSSEKPNFQNITRSGHYGIPGMRTLFKPSSGNVIVQADYSQAELRSIAVFSGDKTLNDIYEDTGRSLHKERALAFYGENYSKDQYTQAKNMNFGITYGQGADAFHQMYGIPKEVAVEYIEAWWRDFPQIKQWVAETHVKIVKTGVVVNPFGRKRRFQLITAENKGDVLREGLNFLPQSTASDFTLSSVVELNSLGIPIVATVHDSIVADVPEGEAHEVGRKMQEIMEATPKRTIGWQLPFVVDVSIGQDWGSVEEV